MLAVVGLSAQNIYRYTATQRFKAQGENLLTNGAFAQQYGSWVNTDGTNVSAENWSLQEAVGPNGENALASVDETKNTSLCQAVQVSAGQYAVSFWIKGDAAGNTDKTAVFVNGDGSLVHGTNGAGTPVIDMVTSTTYTDDWTQVTGVVTVADSIVTPFIVINIGQLPTNMMVTDFTLYRVQEVYDVRKLEAKIDFARKMLAEPLFNTAAAAEKAEELKGTCDGIEESIAAGEEDDFTQGGDDLIALNEVLEDFLAIESDNMASNFKTLDFASIGGVGRGRTFGSAIDGTLQLLGGNWGHIAGDEALMSAIQTGMKGHTATFKLVNANLPAGKYFFYAEIRNANTSKSAWPCPGQVFDLTTDCRMNICQDTIVLEGVHGEAYQAFYMIADVKEDGVFEASVAWPGTNNNFADASANNGGAFYIKNVMLRGFGGTQAKAERFAAWKGFLAQYNAMISARNKAYMLTNDGNYPWAQDTLARAKQVWDPYYYAFMEKGWLTAEGADSGVATNDELIDWATTTGIHLDALTEESTPADSAFYSNYSKYALVRGYQYATNYLEAQNKPITDFAKAIDEAKATRNKGTNATGDRATYKTAIETAIATLANVRDNTNDDKREADIETLTAAQQALADATVAFLASAEMKPVVDIDFSNTFEMVEDVLDEQENIVTPGYYKIAGAAGEMHFGLSNVQTDNTVADWNFALGFNNELNDVLHVGGSSYGTVALDTIGGNDVLVTSFDLWYGQLGKGFLNIDFMNADGVRVAGFSYDCYNKSMAYNDFNDAANTGMNFSNKEKSNHDKSGGALSICTAALTNTFTLTINYKTGTVQGTMKNASNTVEGAAIPLAAFATDSLKHVNRIVSFRVGSETYQKANAGASGRRCWFDNLKITRYGDAPADFEEDITQSAWSDKTGIKTVNAVKSDNAIYSITGVRLNGVPQKGMFIMNGRKYVK